MRDRPVDRCPAAGFHGAVGHQPRQIYASAADRRHGRRWARRHRPYWVPATMLALALAAGEALRSLA
jgi:uncharacterized membrane protein